MNTVPGSAGAQGPIAVRIGSLSQLFNSLDPFPFQERDLDRNAEEFIVGWARELQRESQLGRYFEEGLIIICWVANWKPLEIFLYDWWPAPRTRNLYRRLANATVEAKAY